MPWKTTDMGGVGSPGKVFATKAEAEKYAEKIMENEGWRPDVAQISEAHAERIRNLRTILPQRLVSGRASQTSSHTSPHTSATSRFSSLVDKVMKGTGASMKEAVIMIIAENKSLVSEAIDELGSYPASEKVFALLQKHR
jgi:hypothetical protein